MRAKSLKGFLATLSSNLPLILGSNENPYKMKYCLSWVIMARSDLEFVLFLQKEKCS